MPNPTQTKTGKLRVQAPLLIAIAAGMVCYGLFHRRGVWLSVIAYSVAPAERVLAGEVPHRDFLFNYTPGILWVNAALMRLFGVNLLTIHTGLLVFKLATLVALYLLSRKVAGRWAALVPIALTLSWLGHRYIFNVHPAQYYMLFAVLALMCLLAYDRKDGKQYLFMCGLAAGIVLVFKHNVGLALLGCGTLVLSIRAICLQSRTRLADGAKRIGIFYVGFMSVAAAFCLYMQSNDALGPMVDHFVHHAAEYSEDRAIPLPSLRAVSAAAIVCLGAIVVGILLLRRSKRFYTAYALLVPVLAVPAVFVSGVFQRSADAAIAYLPPLLFAAAIVILLRDLRSGPKDSRLNWWTRNGALVTVTLFAAAVYSEMYPRADYYHLVRILPLTFVLLTMLLGIASKGFKHYFDAGSGLPGAARLITVSIPVVIVAAIGIGHTWRPQFDGWGRFSDRFPLQTERANGLFASRRDAEFTEQLTAIIQSTSSESDNMFSFARRGGAFYFLAARRNPTRLLWWDSVGIKPVERDRVLNQISNRAMKLVLIQDALTEGEVREVLESNYHHIGAVGDIAVYRSN